MKSWFCAPRPPTVTSGPAAWAVSRTSVSRSRDSWVEASAGPKAIASEDVVGAPVRESRGRPRPASRRSSPTSSATWVGGGVALDEDLVRDEHAGADAGVLELDEPVLGVAVLGEACRRRRSRSGCCVAAKTSAARMTTATVRGDRAVMDDSLGPAGPGVRGLVVGAAVGPVELAAEGVEDDRQQGQRDGDADQRDHHAAVADAAQEGKRKGEEREQADRDGRAAEDDSPARRLHRAHDRLVALVPVGDLLPPSDHDDQRVVDRHAEPDQGDQELDDRRDVGHERDPVDDQERGHDRRNRHHQRHEREERARRRRRARGARRSRRRAPRSGRPGPRRRRPGC